MCWISIYMQMLRNHTRCYAFLLNCALLILPSLFISQDHQCREDTYANALTFLFLESFFWTTFLLFRSAQAVGSLTAYMSAGPGVCKDSPQHTMRFLASLLSPRLSDTRLRRSSHTREKSVVPTLLCTKSRTSVANCLSSSRDQLSFFLYDNHKPWTYRFQIQTR
jgi:hypothetical protein